MSITNGYCTAAELREQVGDTTGLLTPALLERAVNTTSRAIDKFCGRRFWQDATVQVRTYKPDSVDTAWVDDISTTTGLIIKTDSTADGTFATTWASTDYQLEPLNADADQTAYAWWKIVAIDRYQFPIATRRTTLQVTAKFGWSAVPDGVAEACLLRAAAIFKRREATWGIAGFNDFGPVRITRRDPDVVELLSEFIKMDARPAGTTTSATAVTGWW